MISEKVTVATGDRGVFTTQHPAVLLPVQLTNKNKTYQAGTILKVSAGGTYEPAADADTPACILAEDTDGSTGLAHAGFHGVVVRARLIDASGASAKDVSDTLVKKLGGIGIFVTQSFAGDVR